MLANLKKMLGLTTTDMDEVLTIIIDLATKRLLSLIGEEALPTELEYIVLEVCIKRYNRIGSEGVSQHSVEGETMQFINNDFAEFSNEIQAYINNKKSTFKGRIKFI